MFLAHVQILIGMDTILSYSLRLKETGFVINLKDLSPVIKEKVIHKLDHRNLNIDVDFMKGKIPSTEALVLAIWNELEAPVKELGAQLHKVKVFETENNFVEYLG